MKNKEIRHLLATNLRADINGDKEVTKLEGYITKFNERSNFLGFYETIDPLAFDSSLESEDNIIALYNHDWNKVLGSTKNESLKLFKDDEGLRFELTPVANTATIKEVFELVKTNEIKGVSFGFEIIEDEWHTKDEIDYRHIKDLKLYEISVTIIPAYEGSNVEARSHIDYINEKKQIKKNKIRKRKIIIESEL